VEKGKILFCWPQDEHDFINLTAWIGGPIYIQDNLQVSTTQAHIMTPATA
jgi:hypothetical protein